VTRRAVALAIVLALGLAGAAPRRAEANPIEFASLQTLVSIVMLAVLRLLGPVVGNRSDLIVAETSTLPQPDGSTFAFVSSDGSLFGEPLAFTFSGFSGTGAATEAVFSGGGSHAGTPFTGMLEGSEGSFSFSFAGVVNEPAGQSSLSLTAIALVTEVGVENAYAGLLARPGLPDQTLDFVQTFQSVAPGDVRTTLSTASSAQPVVITAGPGASSSTIELGVTVIPEPSTAVLLGLGVLALGAGARRARGLLRGGELPGLDT
jgi:Flp pilus assembly pilin Flp